MWLMFYEDSVDGQLAPSQKQWWEDMMEQNCLIHSWQLGSREEDPAREERERNHTNSHGHASETLSATPGSVLHCPCPTQSQ